MSVLTSSNLVGDSRQADHNSIYPRVIIIGETFHSRSGGGITLSNLFKDWPVRKIGVITDRIAETDSNSGYSYYQLGREEIRFPFPFSLMQAYVRSGPVDLLSGVAGSTSLTGLPDGRKLKRWLHHTLDKILGWLGLAHSFYRIRISEGLKEWIRVFNPDLIYIQPFLTKTMTFGNDVYRELGIPYVVHIMDDSVSYNNTSLVFRNRNQVYIEAQFRELIGNASDCLCISKAMATEYEKRYGRTFGHFRNPIELGRWLPFQKKDITSDKELLRIVYTGRLFPPTYTTVVDLCHTVHALNSKGIHVELDIYSYDRNKRFNRKIKGLKGTNLMNPVAVKDIPLVISNYDIFFLCLDFDRRAQLYSRFSISTRTSEGMITGIPVLVYAPGESAISNYFTENNSGLVVTEQERVKLEEAVRRLGSDLSLREILSRNAVETAIRDSAAEDVRESFRETLSKVMK